MTQISDITRVPGSFANRSRAVIHLFPGGGGPVRSAVQTPLGEGERVEIIVTAARSPEASGDA